MAGTLWPEHHSAELERLVNEDRRDPEIATIMGRSISSIKHRRKRMGLPSSMNKFKAKNRAWTDDETDLLIDLCRDGKNDEEIGLLLNRTSGGVRARVMRVGARHNFLNARYADDPDKERQKMRCSAELRALIQEHRWFAEKILAGKGGDGLPEWEKKREMV